MPSFSLLDPKDLEAVVDYVLVLTHRGELEAELAGEAEVADEVDPARVDEIVKTILNKWEQARGQVVYPTTPMPEFTAAVVDQGKKAFLTVGCAQCHGEDGRGQMATQRRDRRLGQPDQGGRPDLGDAPRRHRAAGHLPAHRRGHQRHADAVVPRLARRRSPSGSGTWSATC